jgi:hypothetical protein
VRGADRVGWYKGRVVDCVAVDFANVEIFFSFLDVGGGDAVGYTPDFVCRTIVLDVKTVRHTPYYW